MQVWFELIGLGFALWISARLDRWQAGGIVTICAGLWWLLNGHQALEYFSTQSLTHWQRMFDRGVLQSGVAMTLGLALLAIVGQMWRYYHRDLRSRSS